MKQPPKLLSIGIAFLGVIVAGNAQTLLTFDSLPPGAFPDPGYTTIPNSYGGLDWNNFGVVDGSALNSTYGYHSGVVSPNNVAFNKDGFTASITASSGLFDLDSAYLTAALNLDIPLDIQVKGFIGTTLVYDNTYTVNKSAPTFVNFDYIGVDQVTFSSSPTQQFAMDNLTVTVPEPSTCLLLFVGTILSAFKAVKSKIQKKNA